MVRTRGRVNKGVLGLRRVLGWSYDIFLVISRVNESVINCDTDAKKNRSLSSVNGLDRSEKAQLQR
jgi:hypothetical protein